MTTRTARQDAWKGGKWIWPKTRLAIYLRDGWTCTYCGRSVLETPMPLSLDHVERKGGNSPENLTTACFTCNERRNGSSIESWLTFLQDEGKNRKEVEARLERRHLPLGKRGGKRAHEPGSFYEEASRLQADPPLWLTQLRRLAFKVRRQMLLFQEEDEPTYSDDPNSPDFPF